MKKISTKIKFTNEFIGDMKNFGGQFCVGLATKTRDELQNATIDALSKFYEDYTPKSYKRHYWNFMDLSHRGYYKNPHNSIVYGGVELNPAWMRDIYQDPVDEVFDSVLHGFHGVSSGFEEPKSFTVTKVMNPNPLDLIYKSRDQIVDSITTFKQFGIDRAARSSYSTLHLV